MKMSNLFLETLRDAPADAQTASHQLLIRAGFVRPIAAGIYANLPFAIRSLEKIMALIRSEMEAIGAQEINMPLVQPAELWKSSGRYFKIDAELSRFDDRTGREMVLAMTHEELVANLASMLIQSYRQLPALVYQFQTKWRDDPRPRSGLIRTREFIMKDSYSLDKDQAGLDRQYRAHYQAYFNIFNRCSLEPLAVLADNGIMGGDISHEFMVITPVGEDTLILCDNCGYAANRQIARSIPAPIEQQTARPLEKVATPGCKTIAAVAEFLGVPTYRTAKAVFLVARIYEKQTYLDKLVFAVIRGDLDVNETKIANAISAVSLRPATDEEIRSCGAVPGYASPIGLSDVLIIADSTILEGTNLVAGANEPDFHLLNVNFGRDFQADICTDIAAAQAGDSCPQCGNRLKAERAVEVGNIFQLGTDFGRSLNAFYQDEQGNQRPIVMGSYGIGLGRLLATIAEVHHDDAGLTWPISVAPYHVHLLALVSKSDPEILTRAEIIYRELSDAGIEVLFDDREVSAGVKFNDADLIGIPIRLTLSSRSLKNGGLEYKARRTGETRILPLADLVATLRQIIEAEQNRLSNRARPVIYPEE
jgi:prolyl-tRNA synthetase